MADDDSWEHEHWHRTIDGEATFRHRHPPPVAEADPDGLRAHEHSNGSHAHPHANQHHLFFPDDPPDDDVPR